MATKKMINRRRFLKTVGAAGGIGISSISGCMAVWMKGQGSGSSGGKYPPMNFSSQQHRITQKMATQTATDRSSLIKAVGVPDAVVWIPSSATIDMTGVVGVPIAPNVTIASDSYLNNETDGSQSSNEEETRSLSNPRGGSGSSSDEEEETRSLSNPRGGSGSSNDGKGASSNKAKGGTIKTNGYDKGVFVNDTGGCRITGLRLKGPRKDFFEPWGNGKDHEDYSALAFNLQGQTAIVDHCEVTGWTFAGIALGAKNTHTRGWVHHNFMHHNQMNHLGYPMELYNGQHLIEWNYFDHNRHSIAGFGYPTCGYEARFNIVGPNAILHAFDMHYLGENIDELGKSGIGLAAGSFVNIHHNVFELTSYPAFSIQGFPQRYARFCNNWCAEKMKNESEAIGNVVLYPTDADVRVKGNTYGSSTIQQGRKRLQKIEPKLLKSQDSSTDDPPKATPTPMKLEQLLQKSA